MRDGASGSERGGRHVGGALVGVLESALGLGYAIVVAVAILVGGIEGPARVVLAAPLLGFLPGYALVAVLFPGPEPANPTVTHVRERGLTWFERCALSVAGSIMLLVVLGVALSAAGLALETSTFVVSLLAVVAVGAVVDGFRRVRRPHVDRFRVPVDRWLDEARAATAGTEARLDAALNVALVLAVVLALSGLAYGLAAPPSDASDTHVTLLDRQDGELVASNYTTVVAPDEPVDATVAIENREGTSITYTVVVLVERLQNDTVLQRQEAQRTTVEVPAGERGQLELQAPPRMVGDDLRYSVLVYHDDPPEQPTPANAPEHLYLWVDVSASPSGAA